MASYYGGSTPGSPANASVGEPTLVAQTTNPRPARIANGTYTGDGAGGGQAVAVGFRPRIVHIVRNATTTNQANVSDPNAGDAEAGAGFNAAGTWVAQTSAEVNITANGFTADSYMNTGAVVYLWLAIG